MLILLRAGLLDSTFCGQKPDGGLKIMLVCELLESDDRSEYTRITSHFMHDITMIATRGRSLFDLHSRKHGFGYHVILTTKVPDHLGYGRIIFRVVELPDNIQFLRQIVVEDHLGSIQKPSTKTPLDISGDIRSMPVEEYRAMIDKASRICRYLLGAKTVLGLIHKWTGSAYAWKLLGLVHKGPPIPT